MKMAVSLLRWLLMSIYCAAAINLQAPLQFKSTTEDTSMITTSATTHFTGSPVSPLQDCLMPALQDVYLSEGFGYEHDCIKSTGTLRGHMIFIDFPDAPHAQNESMEDYYAFLIPGARDWYWEVSDGALNFSITADYSQWYRMRNASTAYNWRLLTHDQHVRYLNDAVAAWSAAVAGTFQAVDVLYVVASKQATAIWNSPTYMGPTLQTPKGQFVAEKAVTIGLDAWSWGHRLIPHETGHTMCLPDLYLHEPGTKAGIKVGGFDLMGNIHGISPRYMKWHLLKLHWINLEVAPGPQGVSRTGKYSFRVGTGSYSTTPMVIIRLERSAVLVIEARGTSQPAGACGRGILLYTVSSVIGQGFGPIEVLDTQPNSGGCKGEELNDAPLALDPEGEPNSFISPYWDVKVTVLEENAVNHDEVAWMVEVEIPDQYL